MTRRSHAAWLSLPALAETWHGWCGPAGSWGCARQPARQPPGTLLPVGPASRPCRLSLCPYGTGAHLSPDPGHSPTWGSQAQSRPQGQLVGKGRAGFQVSPRCHGTGVAAGAWQCPKPPGTGCVAQPWCQAHFSAPSPLIGPKPPHRPLAQAAHGAGSAGGPGPVLNLSRTGRGHGTPLCPALHPHLPWLCPCACCLADPVPCHAMLCCAVLFRRPVSGQRDSCPWLMPALRC